MGKEAHPFKIPIPMLWQKISLN